MSRKLTIFFVILLSASAGLMAADIGSFQEFYAPDKSWGWGEWTLMIGGVALAAAITAFTAGAAAPAAAGLTGAIGGALGLTGTAALVVGTIIVNGAVDVAFQVGADEVSAHFDRSKFEESSKRMITLPFLKNPYGGGCCKAIFKKLSDINDEISLDSAANSTILDDALSLIEESESTGAPKFKENLIKAVILFRKGDYHATKVITEKLLGEAKANGYSPSMAYFLTSVTSLYDDEIDLRSSIAMFDASLKSEPDNPIFPVLYGMYMDRISYLMSFGRIPTSAYKTLVNTTTSIKDKKTQSIAIYILYARCINLIERCHNHIKVISVDESFNDRKSEKLLWSKYSMKSELEKMASLIYSEFVGLSSDKETSNAMEEMFNKAKELEETNDFWILVTYSARRRWGGILTMILFIIVGAAWFYQRRRGQYQRTAD